MNVQICKVTAEELNDIKVKVMISLQSGPNYTPNVYDRFHPDHCRDASFLPDDMFGEVNISTEVCIEEDEEDLFDGMTEAEYYGSMGLRVVYPKDSFPYVEEIAPGDPDDIYDHLRQDVAFTDDIPF